MVRLALLGRLRGSLLLPQLSLGTGHWLKADDLRWSDGGQSWQLGVCLGLVGLMSLVHCPWPAVVLLSLMWEMGPIPMDGLLELGSAVMDGRKVHSGFGLKGNWFGSQGSGKSFHFGKTFQDGLTLGLAHGLGRGGVPGKRLTRG